MTQPPGPDFAGPDAPDYLSFPPPSVPQYAPPTPPATLPVEPSDYYGFWRTPIYRPWRPIVAVLVALVGFFVVGMVVVIPALIFDLATGRTTLEGMVEKASQGQIDVTPAMFIANNISLALMVPVSMLVAWWFSKQRPRWMSSVAGGLRWRWLWACVGALVPLWIAYTLFDASVGGYWSDLSINSDTWVLLVGILVTTPFQAAGEEYLFRGLGNRAIAGLFPTSAMPWRVLVPGAITSGLFMLAHGAGDPWLNVFYFLFGAIASYLTWRTGGLEASIAMHVVNNLLGEAFLPFTDISGIFDRQAGVAGPAILINMVVPILGVIIVEVLARRMKPQRVNAPASLAG